MPPTLQARIHERIANGERAYVELQRRAEDARASGDMARYWAIAAPRNLADLALLAGDEVRAMELYAEGAAYYRERRAWAAEQGQPLPPLFVEASAFFMAGARAEAQTALRALATSQPAARGTLVGIALIATGATDEGRHLLQWRANTLHERHDGPAALERSEIAFWLGDLTLARDTLDHAIRQWYTPQLSPTASALQAVFGAFAAPDDPHEQAHAQAALAASIQAFYDDDFLKEAIDVHEYRRLLTTAPDDATRYPRIRGLMLRWNT